jgi:hypothetical protein
MASGRRAIMSDWLISDCAFSILAESISSSEGQTDLRKLGKFSMIF